MKTLNREDFKRIYDVACDEWQTKLLYWYGSKFAVQDKVEIKDSEYNTMRDACTIEQHQLFDEIFGKEQDITDKIKSLGDAVRFLEDGSAAISTPFQKLVVIVKALNDGWYPNWTDGTQNKYSVWFDMSKNTPSFRVWGYCASGADVPSRLLLRSSKLAEYCGKQFEDIWVEYFK